MAPRPWSTAGNWSPNGVPTSSDDVCFDGSVTAHNQTVQIDVPAVAKTITVASSYTAAINVSSGVSLHVYGALTYAGRGAFDGTFAAGDITIDGSLTLSSGAGTFNVANASTTTTIGGALNVGARLAGHGGAINAGSIDQTANTFTGGNGTIQVTGAFVEEGGTFTAGSSAVQIGTSLTVSAGTFGPGAGNVQVGTDLILSGGTLTGSSGKIQLGGNMSVAAGTFSGSSGVLKIPGNLTLSGSGSFRASSSTTYIGGAFTNTASGGAAAFNDNNGNLVFNATTSQTHVFGGATFKKATFNDGMVAYWNLDQATAASAIDNSGYGNTGTPTGVTQATTTKPPLTFVNSRYATFDGVASSISATVANLPAASAAQSISAWVNVTAMPVGTASVVSLTGASSAVKLGLSPTNLQVLRNDGTALISAAAPSSGAWHHVAYTWDGTTNRLYVDGTAATPTLTSHDSGAVTAACLGATGGAIPTDFYAGLLDEVRIYDRPLAVSEIGALALGGMPAGGIATHTFGDDYLATVGSNVADFVIASGIVTGTHDISIEGSWLNYGGRYTGTGTVTFTSNGGEILLSGGSAFTAVVMNGTGANGTHTLYDRMWIPGGTLTLASTTKLSLGAYTMHVGSLAVAAGATLTPSTGTVVIDGTDDQTLQAASFYGLRLEDPGELGLVGYWKLDEGAGPGTTREWSGTNNVATLSGSGAAWTGPCPSIGFDDAAAMSFDGTSGYVSAGPNGMPAANAAQTISAWVNVSALPSAASSIVSLTGPSSAVKLGLSATDLQVLGADGTALISTTAPSTAAWHHVAYTWDGASNKLYVDGVAATATATAHDGGGVTNAFIGATSATAGFFNGKIDDVRVYNLALSPTQVARLAAGRYAGTGGYPTVTLSANTTVSRTLALDAGNLATGPYTMAVSYTGAAAAINTGTYEVGGGGASIAAASTFSGGLTVQAAGVLKLGTPGGSVQLASGKTLAIDGTLLASSTGATIQGVSGSYAFQVGATATARPTLNISGLAVKNTNANGMWINAVAGASTTFTRFDNVAFSNGTSTTSGMLLQIYATGLYLTSNGCSFDSGITATTKYTVKLTGNGHTGTPDTTQTRAMFGGATCSATFASCQASKSDDDSNSDGLPSTPASNGAVVQFVRAAMADTAGTVVGLPVTAFDWNDYSYYSTYFAYNSASGTSASIYVRNGSGAAQYSWTSPGADTIVGTPRATTAGTTHYLYVATSSGKVYQLVDTGSALTTVGAAWATNPFDCGCTIVTPLGMDSTNLYWGGTRSGNKLWTLGLASESQPLGSPFALAPTITTASPAIWIRNATTYAFVGTIGHILEINVSNQTLVADNTNPGSASVWGRIALGTHGANRILTGDDGGTFWAVDPGSFAGTQKAWKYTVTGDAIKSSPYYHYSTSTVHFGTEGGKIVALDSTGAALSGYPYQVATASDPIRAAVLYWSGVLVVGTQTGKLFFIDRSNGSGPVLLSQYSFGPSEVISGIGYDNNVNRYMVSVADPAVKDGRIYYFDLVPNLTQDPTPSFQ